jgi:hypothetical protein
MTSLGLSWRKLLYGNIWCSAALYSCLFQVLILRVLDFYPNFLPLSLGHTDGCLYHFCYRNNNSACIIIVGWISSFQTARNFIFCLESDVIQELQTGRPQNHSNTCHGSGAGVSFGLQPTWNVVGRRKLLASEPQSNHITILQHSAPVSQDDINSSLLHVCIGNCILSCFYWPSILIVLLLNVVSSFLSCSEKLWERNNKSL